MYVVHVQTYITVRRRRGATDDSVYSRTRTALGRDFALYGTSTWKLRDKLETSFGVKAASLLLAIAALRLLHLSILASPRAARVDEKFAFNQLVECCASGRTRARLHAPGDLGQPVLCDRRCTWQCLLHPFELAFSTGHISEGSFLCMAAGRRSSTSDASVLAV
eukprot:scaffold19357_cov33-Prasinocladus_malaysianus.AAC.1